MNFGKITGMLMGLAVFVITAIIILLFITKTHSSTVDMIETTDRDENSWLGEAYAQMGAGAGANANEKGIWPMVIGLILLIAGFGAVIGAIMYLKTLASK